MCACRHQLLTGEDDQLEVKILPKLFRPLLCSIVRDLARSGKCKNADIGKILLHLRRVRSDLFVFRRERAGEAKPISVGLQLSGRIRIETQVLFALARDQAGPLLLG
jgi:hypothetical protein